jgi:hypothetical protein
MRVIQARYGLAGALVVGVLAGACGGSTVEPGSPGGSAGSGGAGGISGSAGSGGAGGTSGSAGSGGAGGTSGSAGSGGAGGTGGVGRTPEKHRPSATACDKVRPGDDPMVPDAGSWPCRAHADCIEGQNGRCSAIGRGGWACTYDECFADADCGGPGGVCACDGSSSRADNNVCLSGNCRTDADCGAAGFCSPTFGSCGNYSGVVSYYCHTPQDECVDDADCGGPAGYCAYVPAAGHWKCSNAHCVG